MGEYLIQYTEVTIINDQYPVLTSSRKGIFFQKDYYDGNQIASENNIGYNIVPYGYFTYRHMSDDEIFYFNINNIIDNGIVSTLYPVFTTNNRLDSKFLQYELNFGKEFRKYSVLQKQGGSRTYMYFNKLRDLKLTITTSLKEQECIRNLICSIDHLITLHQRKLEKLKIIKKSMLENLFPQNEEKTPKIRFLGFTKDWEQRKLGEIAEYKKGPFGSALRKDIFVQKGKDTVKIYEQQNAICKDCKLERYFVTKEYANKLTGFEVHGGDIIVSCAGTIGEIYEIPYDAEMGIINQALMRIKVYQKVVDKGIFIILFSKLIDKFSIVHSNGSAIKNIPAFSDLKPTIVFVPSIAEQKKIRKCFESIDHLITLHQLEPFQLIFKAIAYRIIDYAKSKPLRCRKYTGLIAFIKYYVRKLRTYAIYLRIFLENIVYQGYNTIDEKCVYMQIIM